MFHYKKKETFLSSKKSAAVFLSANFAFSFFSPFFWVSLNFTKKFHLLTIPISVNICEVPLFTKMNTRVFFSEMLFKTLVAFMWCSTTRGGGCGCTWQRKKQWKHSDESHEKRRKIISVKHRCYLLPNVRDIPTLLNFKHAALMIKKANTSGCTKHYQNMPSKTL